MKASIKEILDLGLEISNNEGGYMKKVDWDEGPYLFQTSYRSSRCGEFDSMVREFLQEAKIEDDDRY